MKDKEQNKNENKGIHSVYSTCSMDVNRKAFAYVVERVEGFNRESIARPDLRVCYHGKCCPRSWEVKSVLP